MLQNAVQERYKCAVKIRNIVVLEATLFITKSGTMAFFDCHRKIVFREAEGDIWAKDYEKGKKPKLSTYPVPMASSDEILIEKTPHIINRGYDKLKARAELMKKTMKDVKILVMLCDPVKRFISLEKHHTPVNWSATTRDKLTGIGLKLSTDNPGKRPSKGLTSLVGGNRISSQ